MNNKFKLVVQNILIFVFSCARLSSLLAHDVPVHEQITLHAAASAAELSAKYNDFIATIGGPIPLSVNGGPPKTPFGWMIEGSAREDDNDNATG